MNSETQVSECAVRWRPYPAYKESGIEWLGEIPSGWTTILVKRRFEIQLGKMLQNNPESDADVPVRYLKALHVLWGKLDTSDLPEMWASPSDIRQFGVRCGDLLVCEGGEAGRAGVAGSLPDPCIIQNALHRVRGKGADVRFFYYVLHVVGSAGWFDVLCNKATISHFTREKLAELSIPLPPNLDEQRAIADFLDRETARIDALIAKKRRQIELLQEKRIALISHAVTKGLDPNARMKPSGIEWLGEVPSHWEVKRLKQLCTRSALYGANEPADSYASEGARFLRTTDITDEGKLVGDGVYLPMDAVREYILEDGDILFSRSGTIGRSLLYRRDSHGPCAYAGYLVRFVPGPMLDSCFAFYFSKSKAFERWLGGAVISSTIGNVNGQKFANLEMPCPSHNEQRAIAAFLDRETARIDALIGKVRESIELLREYRAALISAAVTGKIDVCQEAA